jgi:plasmid stability protein
MATLTIRNLPDDVRDRLRVRAAENGRSMEAEVREVLSQAVPKKRQPSSPEEIRERVRSVQAAFEKYKRPGESVVDEFLAERRRLWGED